MTIHLKPEQEKVIGQAIQTGLIRYSDDIVEVGVATIRRRLEASQFGSASVNAEDWSRELHTWVHEHSSTAPLLSDEAISREYIYGTRGLNGGFAGHEHLAAPVANPITHTRL